MSSDKATVTVKVQELVTVNLEGHEPIADLLKKSEWNGMWELVNTRGEKVIVLAESGSLADVFMNAFTPNKPREVRVVAASPNLLVPIAAKETA